MHFFVVGVNHKSGPLALRENLAQLWGGDQKLTAQAIKNYFGGRPQECLVLATCNRYEIYGVDTESFDKELKTFIAEQLSTGMTEELYKNAYTLKDGEALKHLFSVASGLDSMVVGESEILGQVKNAYEEARLLGHTKGILNTVFQKSLFVGKRARAETGLAQGKLSVASVAMDLAGKIFDDFSSLILAVVGAGAMGLETAKNLMAAKPRQKIFLSRSFERAQTLSLEFGGLAGSLQDLPRVLLQADVVVTQLKTAKPALTQEMMAPVMRRRRRSLFILDIAMPRNVEEKVCLLDNVYLYNIDDLKQICEENYKKRIVEVNKAQVLLQEEISRFLPQYELRLAA